MLTRRRLLNRLYDMVDRRLALISAPAGYGKTSLLVDFAHDLEHPMCWYTLDRGDHDPRAFLEHLILSLQHRFPEFGERTRQALATTTDLGQGAPGILNVLINEIVDTIPRWFVLVLDDYHRLGKAPEVGEILGRLLTYQTDQFLLVISSRRVPELSFLIQLTAKGQVDGLGQEELRFRSTEIQALLAQNYQLHVREEEASELAAQSEGWITGILLTAHTMWRSILENLARARTSDQPVYEYLAQEVFAQQEPAVQSFLTVSSTLQEVSPELCREALGLEHAGQFLDLLEERNLFITPLEGEWYRYHHLFREYLQMRLRRSAEDRWSDLHRRAAGWFASHGQPEEAIEHYLTIEAYVEAGRVMEAEARRFFYAGRLETLMSWGSALPDAVHEAFPHLALFRSRAAEMLGRWDEALELADVAERGHREREEIERLAYVHLHRCVLWEGMGRFEDMFTLAQEVLSLAVERGIPVHYEACRLIGRSCLFMGRLEEGERYLRDAVAHAREQAGVLELSAAQSALAECLWRLGHWDEAVDTMRQAVEIRRRMGNTGALVGVLNDLGFYLYSIGEYEEALHLLEEGVNLGRQLGQPRDTSLVLLSLAELKRDLGALAEAADACQESVQLADDLGYAFISAYGRDALGLIERCRGNHSLALQYIEDACVRAEQQRSEYQLGRYEASLGLVQAEDGALEAGLECLDRARERLRRIGAQGELARAWLYTAWALFCAQREEEALEALDRAWHMTKDSGRESLFIIEGQRMLPLLERASTRGVGDGELNVLLERVQDFQHKAQALIRSSASTEPEQKPTLRIFGFGYGRAELGGEEIPPSDWEAASVRQLLFYLLLHGSQTRDQIAAALWPELPAHKVKATFHTTKFRLKRALDRDAVHFDGTSYHIHPELEGWFDVAVFQELLQEHGVGRPEERLQQAVDLYQADFLVDCYADWCIPIRERLREQYLEALEELAQRLMVRRQYRQALEILRRGLEVDNLREDLHRQLMRAYALSGRGSEAIAQYQHCAEILERELGVSPSPRTTALYHRILEGLPLD